MNRNRINVFMPSRRKSNNGLKTTIAALVVSNLLAVYMIVDYRAQVRGFDGFIQAQLDSAARVE